MPSRVLNSGVERASLRARARRYLQRTWRALGNPDDAGHHRLDQELRRRLTSYTLIFTYWSSHLDDRTRTSIRGRATSLSEALRACEEDHGNPLTWREVDTMHWAARAGDTVYSVRSEA